VWGAEGQGSNYSLLITHYQPLTTKKLRAYSLELI
jgi:hypothetical protein